MAATIRAKYDTQKHKKHRVNYYQKVNNNLQKEDMKQPRQQRASQFSPFAALRGLEELIEDKTVLRTPRRELLEDAALELCETIARLRAGDEARVTYYHIDRYITTNGRVEKLDEIYRNIRLDGRTISFDDILDIEIINHSC